MLNEDVSEQMSDRSIIKRHFGVFFFYLLLAFSFLSPIASNKFVPQGQDMPNHVGLIAQAAMAEKEGQLPIRTMPWEFHGAHPAAFQFYGPSAYTFAGYIHRYFFPNNPYTAYKTVVLLSLLFGAFFIYRLSLKWTDRFPAAFLSGFVYMAAPYFLIDILARGAFAESVSLGLIPIVLYYTYALFSEKLFSIKYFLLTAFSWYFLMTTHLVSFVNSTFFLGLFFLLLSGRKRVPQLCRVGFAYVWAWLIGAWFLGPLLLQTRLLRVTGSAIASSGILMSTNFLTAFSKLLSVTAIFPLSPTIPGSEQITLPFYPGIGWPMLIGVIVCTYYAYKKKTDNTCVGKLLFLFVLAFIAAWSPVNFWQYLPNKLVIAQFSYRFLGQVMWIGALLLGWAVMLLMNYEMPSKKISNLLIILFGTWLIGISNSSWLMANYVAPINIYNIKDFPTMGYARGDYLIELSGIPSEDILKPTVLAGQVASYCQTIPNGVTCQLPEYSSSNIVQLPLVYYPHFLDVLIDGKKAPYFGTFQNSEGVTLVGLPLLAGKHHITCQFVGLHWANKVSIVSVVMSFLLLATTFFRRKNIF